jgi:hypothetical protein
MGIKKNHGIGKRFLVFLVFSMFLVMSCGLLSDPSAKTAQEFVQKYSEAYKNGNAGVLVKMTELGSGQTEDSLKDNIKKDIESKRFGYVAWSNTRYVSEEDRGNYIRVNVEISGAQSQIVLVKREGLLKLALNPSAFE